MSLKVQGASYQIMLLTLWLQLKTEMSRICDSNLLPVTILGNLIIGHCFLDRRCGMNIQGQEQINK